MKKLFSIFAAVLFAGSMMAAEAQHFTQTITLNSGTFTAASEDVPAFITWKGGNDKLTIKQLKGKGTADVNKSYIGAPRVYKGHILSFEAEAGYTIDTVIITCNNDKFGNSMAAGTTIGADTIVPANKTAIDARLNYSNGAKDTLINKTGVSMFYLQNIASANNTQLRFTAVEVRYTKAATLEPSITVGNVSFGTFVPGVSNNTKEFDVIGENLSSAITANLTNGTDFSLSGDLTAAGGKLTVTLNSTTDGDHSDNIQFKVGETLYAESTVTAHIVNTTGLGTKENPFTVPDVKSLNNTFPGNYWVEGYILGGIKEHQIDNSDSTAIALAATMDSPIDTIEVQLPKGDIRNALNGNTSAGKKIKIKGSLESYNSVVGLKTPTDYEFIANPSTAIFNAEATEQKALKIVENGQLFIIKNGVKYNAQGTIVK
ncbi:MAG: hypothetical protein J5621_04215 [Paludibacteraceae bacterium]|nr:hypothetical protein [Paludibacteraceae bacterium]